DDDYELPDADILSNFNNNESEPQHKFFFDQIEEPPQELEIGSL
ncbi:12506_t:CDS:1, partial [Racocetra persica]